MAIEIRMPALSPTMEEGTLAKWLVAEGDEVRSGDVIAEIETDKATMEVEAVDEGVVASILIAAGSENVAVGTVIALLAEDGEDAASVAAAKTPASAPEPQTAPTPEPKTAPAENSTPGAVSAPSAQTSVAQPSAVPAPTGSGGRIFASPLARRIAADRGVDLAALAGSGPHGRILRADVEAAVTAPAVAPASMGAPAAIGMVAAPGSSELVANSQMRKVIAERLQQSKQTAPHFYLTVDCEIDQLLASRRQLNALAGDGVKISVNDLVIRAAAQALIQVPEANASWEGDHTRRFAHADISMAVAIEGGLITPVIWAAEQKGLAELSQISRDLAERARAGSLAPEEFTGGSFTISNLGMFGVREFAAVINPPQGAILAVGAGEERPIVRDGALAVATVMTVTLSCDHRAVDGAVGARWLQSFKSFIENPVTMLL
ncbi:MAG: pyruvate dehydrogenase complex dihydrolipoamide acetyltransferase [Candidatus Puniceispirillaceae bacterium]